MLQSSYIWYNFLLQETWVILKRACQDLKIKARKKDNFLLFNLVERKVKPDVTSDLSEFNSEVEITETDFS